MRGGEQGVKRELIISKYGIFCKGSLTRIPTRVLMIVTYLLGQKKHAYKKVRVCEFFSLWIELS
ncbi:MAG: hypothetical protein ACK559_13125, partial [bacterium]